MRNSNSQKQKSTTTANRYTHSTVRLGDLTTPLGKRAASESKAVGRHVTASAVIKKALRAYLDGNYVQVIEAPAILDALAGLRSDLARVGGNLNQLAHIFNMESRVDKSELQKNHEALQTEFRQITGAMREIERELYKRR